MSAAKMDPAVRAKWVEALRSGRYQQTKWCLKDMRGHCCLGVLVDVLGRWDDTDVNDDRHFFRFEPAGSVVLGLPRDRLCTLAGQNDDGASFTEIADYIEEHL